ncbi:MAG: hypothetical protein J3Q66DRAFT_400086 [Benniella sp.]|nr:MAG: hypothetical protein J3Q66DRAFT_400086 [Benniella sp.]
MAKIATRWVLSGEITSVGFTPNRSFIPLQLSSRCLALSRDERHLAVAQKDLTDISFHRAAMHIKSKDIAPMRSSRSWNPLPVHDEESSVMAPIQRVFVIGKDKEMVQDYASGDESLGDFIVEDETGTYLEMKRVSAIQKSTLKTQPVKELHPRFQSGSSRRDDRRYLVSVEFHDKVAHRGFHFMDNFRYSMACLGLTETLFVAVAKDGNPSTVFTKPIALNAESANVATSRGYVRIFSQSRIQRALFSAGSVIAAAGKTIRSSSSTTRASRSKGLRTWVLDLQRGIGTEETARRHAVDQGQWVPILGAMLIDVDAAFRPHYWPIGLTDQASTCIKCCRGEYEPSYHKPVVTELALKMPTLYQDTSTGKHEEAWLRHKILSGLTKDGKMAGLFGRTDNTVAKKELEMDKKVLQMIDLACKADRTQKSLDLTAMLCKDDGWSEFDRIRRWRLEKELSRQEDALRKRKANGAPSGNGGQRTLSMFSKPTAASTSTYAEAKRLKTQRDEDADMEMDADDMLEDAAGDSDGGEEAVPALAVIPERQEDLEESIEHTRGYLEKRRVELSPARTSSSVLSGFKINGA